MITLVRFKWVAHASIDRLTNYRDEPVLISHINIALMIFLVLQDDPLEDLDPLLKLDDEGQLSQDGQVFDVRVGEEEAFLLVHLLSVEKRGRRQSPHLENHLMRSDIRADGRTGRK